MKLELIRKYHPEGTNGRLVLGGLTICATIELPWRNNEHGRSCVPEGRYQLVKRYSPKFKWHLMLKDVPGRSLILLHPANDALQELKGCIAPVSVITGTGKGAGSVRACTKLKTLLYPALDEGNSIFLTIKTQSK